MASSNTLKSEDSGSSSPQKRNGGTVTRRLRNRETVKPPAASLPEKRAASAKTSPLPTIKHKRIKLTFKEPENIVTHPDHVVAPEYTLIQDYLSLFKYFMDEELLVEDYEERVQEQADLIKRLGKAFDEGILYVEPHTKKIVRKTKQKSFQDPYSVVPTYQDHLVAQGASLAKIFRESQKGRNARIRKLNFMVENYFKQKSGADERERKEHEKNMRRLAKNTVMMVKKRWKEVEKAYDIMVEKRLEMEKIEEGKKTMDRMVLDSSLRAVGHAIKTDDKPEAEEQEEEEEEEEEKDGDEDREEDDEDEEGDEEEEAEGQINDEDIDDSELESNVDESEKEEDDDSALTQEELRKKYAFLENYKLEEDNEDVKQKDNVEEKEEESAIEITEEDRKRYEALEKEEHDSMLDSDESLSDSESEISESDYEEDRPRLADFFGAGNEVKDDEDDEDETMENIKEEDAGIHEIKEEPEDEKETEAEKVARERELKSEEFKSDASASIPDVPVPSLLRGKLRVYQKQGLNWLANLYNNHTNGILADEMGLGKTIQTIALIAYLACEKQNWGPHLIVVPTSVIMNWEMEFKKFAPGFKVLTYYGNPQQRKEKRKGWNKQNTFHVCITSYQLVIHDHLSFRRRRWEYMILDEAHNIKNFRTARWQALLNFNTNRRLLLTGTPLQNNLAELWSLLYFLMPSSKDGAMPEGFASLDDFQQWFGRPVDKIVEGGQDKETRETINKLHKVLRPYLLRRLKADVETQMPQKYEHIMYCRLSKRQRFLYDDFMSRAQTKETLASGNFLSIINCLMQLRKVCNHPDLFEVRPVMTPFAMEHCIGGKFQKELPKLLSTPIGFDVDLNILGYVFSANEYDITTTTAESMARLNAKSHLSKDVTRLEELLKHPVEPNYDDINAYYKYYKYVEQKDALDHLRLIVYINEARCLKRPVYGANVRRLLHVANPFNDPKYYTKHDCYALDDMIKPLSTRMLSGKHDIASYGFAMPAVVALDQKRVEVPENVTETLRELNPDLMINNSLHQPQMQLSIQFPDKSLLLYDSGKLQRLARLLAELKQGGHRALIFTQMTKVLDILERFLNSLGYLYMRLDGATKIEDRQLLTEKFNRDTRITCFILLTRSGGLGINLTGADTVIFYDNDWNPAMDKQCQDRCHRIGQTRDVHIYRFVSEFTIEENIMRKSNYKRKLDNVVIQDGDFTTDYFGKLTLSDILGTEGGSDKLLLENGNVESLAQAEDAEDAAAAKEAAKESNMDVKDFQEEEKEEEEEGEDDGVGHVDEYMLRFIEQGYYYS